MTFVLVHGSWHTGEAWHQIKLALEQAGVTTYTPTLSGMESIDDPGGPEINLSTHIESIVSLIENNDLSDAILVGHSYGGLVIAGVADRLPDRVSKLIYLDAFIPENNQSLFDIMGAESEANMRTGLVNAEGMSLVEGAEAVWLLPPGDAAFYLEEDTDEATVAWLQERLVYKPVETFAEKLIMQNPERVRSMDCTFIHCTKFDYLQPFKEKAESLGYPIYEIETGHDAMLLAPQKLTEILLEIKGAS